MTVADPAGEERHRDDVSLAVELDELDIWLVGDAHLAIIIGV